MKPFAFCSSMLAMALAPLANPLSAEPDVFGLFVGSDESFIGFMPEAAGGDQTQWSTQWRVSLRGEATTVQPIFEAQWTEEHYRRHNAQNNDVVQAFTNDLSQKPFAEGNPLDDLVRCGRGPETPHSRHTIQIALCNVDEVQLDFRSFGLNPHTPFAVKLYGAQWKTPRDDLPGLYQQSLPNGWMLRKKASAGDLNTIRLSSRSRAFAVLVQGPGINSGDPAQYGSLSCLYYIPRNNQALNKTDRHRTLLKLLREKLRARQNTGGMPEHLAAELMPALAPPAWRPAGEELRARKSEGRSRYGTPKIVHFSPDGQIPRRSQIYWGIVAWEAVTVHAYDGAAGVQTPLLANLLCDERAKGEDLRRLCQTRFNPDELPEDLQDILFDPQAPFQKIRFQIVAQTYGGGNPNGSGTWVRKSYVDNKLCTPIFREQTRTNKEKGNRKEEVWHHKTTGAILWGIQGRDVDLDERPIDTSQYAKGGPSIRKVGPKEHPWEEQYVTEQCLRPHYAIANMPCQKPEETTEGNKITTLGGDTRREKICPALTGTCYAMRLFDTDFVDRYDDGGSPFFQPDRRPQGFWMKSVSTHEFTEPIVTGKTADTPPKDIRKSLPNGMWGVSPSNCCIAGTGNNRVSQSFYSIVMGKCMAYCDAYKAPDQWPWDEEITAIVTLHILLENASDHADADIAQNNVTEGQTLSAVAQGLYARWEEEHRGDNPNQKPKNPFQAFYDLTRTEAPDAP